MEFRVLGPLEVVDNGRSIELGGGRQRKLLAILLLHVNEVVSSDRLIDELWGERPPETAAKALQGHVSQLRKALGRETLATQAPGYVLRASPEHLDVRRFERLVEEADQAEPKERAARLREAIGLWRGPTLAEFAFDPFAQAEIARLEELRLVALEDRIEADLELGRHGQLVGELESLVAQHPLRERLRGHLMLALYRSGRQAEALQAYHEARATLVDELGLEPSEDLQQLQRAILAHDPLLGRPAPIAPPIPPVVERILHRPRRLAIVGALLLAGAIAAAVVELTGGSSGGAPVVTANSVAVIDPKTARVTAVVPVGARPVGIAAGRDAVWVANADDGTVSRIDPKTRKVLSTIGIGGDVSDVAIGYGSVWVAGGNDGTLTRINPSLNAVEATLRLGPSSDLSPQPVFSVATGDGHVWITRGNSILEIDPATNETVARIPEAQPLGIAVGDGALWVSTAGERVLRLDAASKVQTAEATIPSQGLGLSFGEGGLWLIVSIGQGNVWRFDAASLSPTLTLTTSVGALDLVVGEGAVWTANDQGAAWRIDPRSGHAEKIILGHHPSAIAAGGGAVWVAIG
jgi:YVTN family beta-propeller protein